MRLDAHARDKFLRLVGEERYDYTTDLVTITSDRLPYRKQNRDYCEYLIKVRYIVQGYWISNHCDYNYIHIVLPFEMIYYSRMWQIIK